MKFKKFLYGLMAVAVAMGMLTTTLYIERRQNIAVAANAGEIIQDGGFSYQVNSDGKTVTFDSYSGYSTQVVIPSTVTDDEGNEYTVTEIGNGFGSVISYIPFPYAVTVPNTVTKINDYAFSGCYTLNEINIQDSVKSIGQHSFSNSGLTSVNIPGSVKSIGIGTFQSCSQLTTVTIEEGVESIGEFAFLECPITSIKIPNSVTNIGGNAFQSTALESVTIPSSVQTMGISIFSGCSNLKKVKIEEGVRTIAGNMFFGCQNLETVDIPNSVVSICDHAFSSCTKLTSVDIPESVTSIGESAFESSGLTSVKIPESVRTIGDHAFASCMSLSKANIPAGIILLGNEAFNAMYYAYPNDQRSTEITYNGTKAQWDALSPKPQGAYISNVKFAGGEGSPSTALPAPTGLSYEPVNERDVQISWQPIAGASKYVFMYCKFNYEDYHYTSNWYMNYVPSNSIDDYGKVTIELRGLARNQQYALTVAAISADGTIGELYHNPDGTHFTFEADYDNSYYPPTNNSAPAFENETFDDLGLSSFQPKLTISKVDGETNATLANAEFGLYTDKECQTQLKTEKTDTDGNAVFSIKIDDWVKRKTYYIKETKAPSGYKISDEVFKAEFKADGDTGKIIVVYSVVGSADAATETPPVCKNEKASEPPPPPPYIPPDPESSSEPESSEPESSEPESSEPESSEPESSEPESSNPETSEPESSEPNTTEPESIPQNPQNPPTGSAFAFLVPAVLASGAAVIATMKRKKK